MQIIFVLFSADENIFTTKKANYGILDLVLKRKDPAAGGMLSPLGTNVFQLPSSVLSVYVMRTEVHFLSDPSFFCFWIGLGKKSCSSWACYSHLLAWFSYCHLNVLEVSSTCGRRAKA